MLTLGIESSGKTASAALAEDGVLLSEYTLNIGLTHSQTLLPLVAEIFSRTGKKVSDLNLVAVSAGPGSFTGLRIGAATGKGIALSRDIPMACVSTLEGLWYNVSVFEGYVHPIMDARRSQVYTQAFCGGRAISDPEARSIDELAEEWNGQDDRPHLLLGDAVPVYREFLDRCLRIPHSYAPASSLLQRASSIALLGESMYYEGKTVPGDAFSLNYVRKPQAEREKEAKGLKEFDIVHDHSAL